MSAKHEKEKIGSLDNAKRILSEMERARGCRPDGISRCWMNDAIDLWRSAVKLMESNAEEK